jgi:fatty-acyl-CoA synthase
MRDARPEWFPRSTVGALADAAARRFADRQAVVDGALRWTFRELGVEIDSAAKALMAAGVEPGDRVALWMTNRAEFVAILLGAIKVGAIAVPLNTRYRVDDLAYVLRHSGARALVVLDRSGPVDYLDMARQVLATLEEQTAADLRLEDFPELRTVAVVGQGEAAGTRRWGHLIAAGRELSDAALAARAAAIDPDSPCIIAYTSGTTGNPKAVLHGHICIRNVVDRASRLGVTMQDVVLNYLPLFHLYALSESLLLSLATGACQVLMDSFDAAKALALAEAERATVVHGFDTHYRDLLRQLAREPHDLSSLRLATFPAGSDEAAQVAAEVEARLCPTVSGYGMTEVWAFAAISFVNSTPEQRSYASGFPMPGMEFRCAHPASGAPCETGEPGELQVSGYNVMIGYFRDEAATAAAFTPDGWFRTGDLALIRPDGHLRFLGRYRDVLKIGGENVSPAEIEAYLARHPAVAEVAVVGHPDERLGEVAVAFIRLHSEGAAEEEELLAFCRGRIASFKIPRGVIFVAELPMTPTGKVRKNLLRDRALSEWTKRP